MPRLLNVMAWLTALSACSFDAALPGAERMGTYDLRAVPAFRACSLDDVTAQRFSFEASFSRDPGTGAAWVTLKQYSRDAGWDGQTLESIVEARRAFGGLCADCPMALEETIRVQLLSQSQNLAAQDRCPDSTAPAVDEDAGIRAPGPDRFGYDAVRACGVLITSTRVVGLRPDGGECPVACSQCSLQYRLTGARR